MSENEPQIERGTDYKTPSWVKVFGIVALVLIILIGIMLLTGEHGPGRHMQSTEPVPSAESSQSAPEEQETTEEAE